MLPRLRIIQVGDVHLPGTENAKRSLDEKDKRFPVGFRNVISAHPTKIVFEQLYRLIVGREASAILFMGDLTDVGELAGYRSCANYIAGALQLGAKGLHADLLVGVVPGNHDINRDLAKKVGLTTKFTPLSDHLQAAGLPAPPISRPVWLQVNNGNAKARMALLNSCWGCGAKEFIPAEFRKDVSAAIEKALKRGQSERTTRAYYDRQFDTPAFNTETVQLLADEAGKIPGTEVLVVCAHHNLLPQRTPRLAPYTELLNSGVLRSMLSDLGRPVVYVHGHIHEDPIEVVTAPGGDPLVCVSAPEATAGFNVLDFVYTNTGLPITCHILKWRFDAAGVFREVDRIVVPLLGRRRRSNDPLLLQLYVTILKAGELYWSTLIDRAATIYPTNTAEQLEESLELLSADGRVSIENYTLASANWIVGAKV